MSRIEGDLTGTCACRCEDGRIHACASEWVDGYIARARAWGALSAVSGVHAGVGLCAHACRHASMFVCVQACMRACVRACVRALITH